MCYRNTLLLLSLSTLILLSGCPKPQPPGIPAGDPGLIEELAMATAADWADKDKFDALYAQGAVPSDKDREGFRGKSVDPDLEGIKIEGDSATFQVVVTTFVNFEPQPATVTWEAKKEGGEWKLTKTPIK